MKRIFPILCVGMVLASVCAAGHAEPFGVASAFNLVALDGNVTVGSDVGGRVAASGTVSGGSYGAGLSGVTVGSAADPWGTLAQGYEIVAAGGLVAGGNYNVSTGNVWTTTTVTQHANQWEISGGGYVNFSSNSETVTTGTASSSPIDFSSLDTSLTSLSGDLAKLSTSSNVTITSSGGPLVLATTSSSIGTYIFNLTSTQFATSNGLDIEVPTGSTVIINVSGTSVALDGAVSFNGQEESVDSISGGVITGGNNDDGGILFNFPDATTVNIGNELIGAVLAPGAEITGSNQMGGTVMAASIDYSGEIHNVEFTGTLPATSVPEGGAAWMYLLLAAVACAGAWEFRRRAAAGQACL